MTAVTDKEIAEINDLLRENLKAPLKVYTQCGPKTLRITPLGLTSDILASRTDNLYERVVEAIRTSEAKGPQKDRGTVQVDMFTFCWWFRYKDSTGTYFMPNGHRELVIALEEDVEDEDET